MKRTQHKTCVIFEPTGHVPNVRLENRNGMSMLGWGAAHFQTISEAKQFRDALSVAIEEVEKRAKV